MKKILAFALKLSLSIAFMIILFEIGLRIMPTAIPLDLLVHFDDDVRAEIAMRIGLPTKQDTIALDRDDGGPELRIYKPFTQRTWEIEETGSTITAVMDEMGFCNMPQNSYQSPTFDIITLGDSFTACHAVRPEDSWSNQLSMTTGKTVYNLGRIGIGLHEYIQLLKKFGLEKSPRIVIMNIYQGNDFRDAKNYFEEINGKTDQGEESVFLSPLKNRYSYGTNLAFAVIKHVQNTYFSETKSNRTPVDFRYQLIFPDETSIPFNPENVDTDEVRLAMSLTTLQADPGIFGVIENALATFVELSKQHNFVPVVTFTPSVYTAYEEYVVFDDPKLGGLMSSFSNEQRQYLRLKSEELGYIFIDFTPSLQAVVHVSDPKELLYYQRDLHLTPAGHAAVAEILYQALVDLEILIED